MQYHIPTAPDMNPNNAVKMGMICEKKATDLGPEKTTIIGTERASQKHKLLILDDLCSASLS